MPRTKSSTTPKRLPKAAEIQKELAKLSNPARAKFSLRYFKTAPGQYGAHDVFRGIPGPVIWQMESRYRDAPLAEVQKLIRSQYHEDRGLALLLLCRIYSRSDARTRKQVFNFYLRSTKHINNWDLVDSSAPHIVGAYLYETNWKLLLKLSQSPNLWRRRISILATFHFIRNDDFEPALTVAERLLNDPEDLIHKAVGWMLREIGKRSPQTERRFLRKHYRKMPRTMLRYAIERFPEPERQRYLHGLV
ncbi:MAG TPA: DNA alkylation repair protein [Acidobacteriota bacterium]|nr:DNA alkylation repair protein [Acidobacteriota bacterium]